MYVHSPLGKLRCLELPEIAGMRVINIDKRNFEPEAGIAYEPLLLFSLLPLKTHFLRVLTEAVD